MRLSAKQKSLVLKAAAIHIIDPALVRLGAAWAVVGRDIDRTDRWSGRLVAEVDAAGLVWWEDSVWMERRRKDVTTRLEART